MVDENNRSKIYSSRHELVYLCFILSLADGLSTLPACIPLIYFIGIPGPLILSTEWISFNILLYVEEDSVLLILNAEGILGFVISSRNFYNGLRFFILSVEFG
jgi:hypothetical protein